MQGKRYMKIFTVIIIAIFTSGCVSNVEHQLGKNAQSTPATGLLTPPAIQYSLFDRQDLKVEDIFALTPLQKSHFLSYFNDKKHENIRGHVRVANYIQEFSVNFSYQGKTLSATDAFDQKTGNCLSLAILSTAFIKETGLRFQYNKVHSEPTYQRYDNIELVSSHVNVTILSALNTTGALWISGSITIDYFRGNNSFNSVVASPEEVEVMFWNNLSSEAIIAGNLDLAFSYALKANSIDPLYPETLNLFAILYNRKGHSEYAYSVYDFMDKNEIVSFSAIDNFVSLLVNIGDTKRAAVLSNKIQHINDDNPYTWLYRGIAHLEKGEYVLAERYLLKSENYGPYLDEPLFNLAKLYAQQNRVKEARVALLKAKELANTSDDKRRYQAKIYSLRD
ncbi:MAG: tetratricopeptide (TPR) repeat protein [Gammaproteobacteria bacterium]|jgi:tetratricopeptide (TPR) repeat protein